MFPSGTMLTREDRARLLRETVLKSSNIDNIPSLRKPDPADLQVPHSRKYVEMENDGIDSGRLARSRQHEGENHETGENVQPPPPFQSIKTPTSYPVEVVQPPRPPPPVFDPDDSDSRSRITELQSRTRRLETDNNELNRRAYDLQHEVNRARDEADIARRERDALRNDHEDLLRQHRVLINERRADGNAWARITPAEWKEANDRVDVLIRENDILMEKSKGNQIELEELRDELLRREKQSNATSHELAEVQQHAAKLRKELNHAIDRADNAVRESKQCADELTDANVENDKLTAELKRTALEVKSQQETIGDLRGSLEEITARYQKHVRESQMLATRERELLDNLKTTEYERDEFKAKYAALMGDHQSLRSENEELLSLSQKFENRIVQLETRDMEGFGELQRQAEIAAEAKLEYDKALIREQQAQAEIQRLADKMLEIPAKARERAEQEINTMRAQFNKEKQQLTAEVTALETKCSHLQHQSERAIRDKRSAESEVEKLTRHIPEEADRLAVTLEELNTRLRTSERDKNLAMGRLETLHQKLLREEHRFEKEKQLVAERSDDAYRRLRTVERDLEETKEDRLHMLTKHTELEHAHKRLAEAKQKAAAQHESDMAALTERHEDHIKDLTTKLETVTESHTRTCRDIQQVLSDQKRASDKWAQDHEQLTHHYEHSLNDLRSQIGRAAARAEDLESQCANARNRIKELMGQLGEEKRNTARAVARCQNAEMRMEGLGRQIASVTSKEAELVEERKRLQRDLDRANLDKERMEREHSLAVRAHNQSRFRNTLRSNVDDHEDDRSLFIDDSSREVRELKARIDRVKHRSNSRAHHHEPLLDDMIDGADDPLDDLSD